jgi:mono/diheme cytochrome c family protein
VSQNGGQEKRPSLWLVLALPVSLAITVFALGFGILSATAIDEDGGGEAAPTTTETQPSPSADGAEIWASQGCGGCHTLSASDATGTVGPNLDETQLSTEEIATIVTDGRNQMPAFSASLSEEDIAAVAAYVTESAAAAQSP